jgi:formiminotetrahydrofolate cyclodeaminase
MEFVRSIFESKGGIEMGLAPVEINMKLIDDVEY